MPSGSTNEAASEALDLNSEAVPLGEEDVSVVRVTESMVSVTVSVAETLTEHPRHAPGPAQGTNAEEGTVEAGVSGEGRNLLETFAQCSDVCEGTKGTHEVKRSSEEEEEEEESADVGLIKENSESETKVSVDAGGDGKLEGQPDVALTLKLSAFDDEELHDRGEVAEAGSSMTITELTSEEILVASGEKAVELEIPVVLNPRGDVLEPMDLDEKPSFPEKNQGVEVEAVGGSTEANGVRDVEAVGESTEANGVRDVEAVGESTEANDVRDVEAVRESTEANGVRDVEAVGESTEANGVRDVEAVEESTEANGVRDMDPSVSRDSLSSPDHNTTLSTCHSGTNPPQDGMQEHITRVAEKPYNQVIRDHSMDLQITEANAEEGAVVIIDTTPAIEAIDESKITEQGDYVTADTTPATEAVDESKTAKQGDVVIADTTPATEAVDESKIAEKGDVVIADTTPATEAVDESKIAEKGDVVTADTTPATEAVDESKIAKRGDVTADTTTATEAVDESKTAVLDRNQDADVQIAGTCGSHYEDQRMGSPTPELGASSSVENQSMGFDVETAAVGGCNKLDENDSDVIILVVDLDSRPCTDVDKKTVEEALNEDERTEVKEIEVDATHFGADRNQKTVDEVLKEDGGTVAKEMGENVSSHGIDGNQKTVDEVLEEEGSRDIEIPDDVTCRGRDENHNTAADVFKEDEGTGVEEMTDYITHLDEDTDKKTDDKIDREDGKTKVREVEDCVTCPHTDGNLKSVGEFFQEDEGAEVKDGSQMVLNNALKEGKGTEAQEMGDDVTHLCSDGVQRNVGEVVKEDEGPAVEEREDDATYTMSECLDDNLTEDISGVHSHVNQKIETSEQVTTIMNPGTASVNDNQVFYGLATEEGEFSVSDLVWGKVKSHPWWPGQIFDPKDASEQAMKYRKKDSFLVAYFGDQTFAWNEASLLKPFRAHFSQMEKQTNVESFCKAVNCALDEIARRVELGLACSCTSEEVYSKIGSQIIKNSGIQEESSRREGVDKSLSVGSFEPEMLVEYIRALAVFPYGGVDRLGLVMAQMQLLAFYRSRGYSDLPKFQLCGGLVENEVDSSILAEKKHSKENVDDSAVISENEDQVLTGKVKLKSRDVSSRKRKQTSVDGAYPCKKERSLSELMAEKTDEGNESVEVAASKPVPSSSGKKRKACNSFSDDSVIQNRTKSISQLGAADADSAQPKRSFKVGESICRVASQLTGSLPIIKCSSERLHKSAVKVDQGSEKSTWDGDDVFPRIPEQRRKIVLPTEHSSPEEMLSQLCLAARDPMKGYSFLTTIISFFSEFRNFVCLDHTNSWKHKMFSEKGGGKKKKLPNSNMDSAESYSFEDMQDSYWTDRIVQISMEEQPLEKSQKKRGRPRKKMMILTNGDDNSHQWSPALDIVLQNPDDSSEQPAEIPMGSSNSCNSPAALILSFSESDADSIPSEKNLNRIFRHFGPLKESATEVLKTTNCARVVFKKRTDAEVALSSAGRFNIFGPMHVSYRLIHWPSTSAKASSFAATQCAEGISPQYIEDVVQQSIEDAPQFIEYVAPQLIEDMAPQFRQYAAPQGIEDMVAQDMEAMAAQGMEVMEAQGMEVMEAQGMEVMEAQGMEDMAQRGMEGMAPQGMEDIMAPQGIVEEMAAQGKEDMAPQGIEDMAPQGIEEMAPQGIEDMELQGMEDMEAQGMEDMAPQGMEYMASQGLEDMIPAGGSIS